jgi:hypothetical protein
MNHPVCIHVSLVTQRYLIIITSAEVKKMWIYTSTSPYAFMA